MSVLRLIRRYERRRRFWRKVRVGGPEECWPWLGAKDPNGFGLSDARLAHERAWELSGHPLPAGTSIEHRCSHRWCVNPHHLVPRRQGD
jgi:hypothetical protein